MSTVQIQNVVKRYGDKLSVDQLSLTINQGEIFGLLGPNGAGKSTTIKMLTGLLSIDQGDIMVGGHSVRKQPLEVKKQCGLVPQDIAIYDELTAKENLMFFGRLYGLKGKELQDKVEQSLRFVGLLDRSSDKPSTFSGGMKRRLNIACAITHQPKLIVLDEPTVGIDPQSRSYILDAVRELNRMGSTIIYTSHYMEEVEAISDRVGIMDHGKLIACGTQAELRERVATDAKLVIEVDRMAEAAVAELRSHHRIKQVTVEGTKLEVFFDGTNVILQDVLFVLSNHQMTIYSLTRVEPDLEMVFLSLTGRTLRD